MKTKTKQNKNEKKNNVDVQANDNQKAVNDIEMKSFPAEMVDFCIQSQVCTLVALKVGNEK